MIVVTLNASNDTQTAKNELPLFLMAVGLGYKISSLIAHVRIFFFSVNIIYLFMFTKNLWTFVFRNEDIG